MVMNMNKSTILRLRGIMNITICINFQNNNRARRGHVRVVGGNTMFLRGTTITFIRSSRIGINKQGRQRTILNLNIISNIRRNKVNKGRSTHNLVILKKTRITRQLIQRVLLRIILYLLSRHNTINRGRRINRVATTTRRVNRTKHNTNLTYTDDRSRRVTPRTLYSINTSDPSNIFLVMTINSFIVGFGNIRQLFLNTTIRRLLRIILTGRPTRNALQTTLLVPRVNNMTINNRRRQATTGLLLRAIYVGLDLLTPSIKIFNTTLNFGSHRQRTILTRRRVIHVTLLPRRTIRIIRFMLNTRVNIQPNRFPTRNLRISISSLLPHLNLNRINNNRATTLLILLFTNHMHHQGTLRLLTRNFRFNVFLNRWAFLLPSLLFIRYCLFTKSNYLIGKTLHVIHTMTMVRPLSRVRRPSRTRRYVHYQRAVPHVCHRVTYLRSTKRRTPRIPIRHRPRTQLIRRKLRIILMKRHSNFVYHVRPLRHRLRHLPAPRHTRHQKNKRRFLNFSNEVNGRKMFKTNKRVKRIKRNKTPFCFALRGFPFFLC